MRATDTWGGQTGGVWVHGGRGEDTSGQRKTNGEGEGRGKSESDRNLLFFSVRLERGRSEICIAGLTKIKRRRWQIRKEKGKERGGKGRKCTPMAAGGMTIMHEMEGEEKRGRERREGGYQPLGGG